MHLRLVLSSIVLAALAANPCFAKDSHARHGARTIEASNGASAKGGSGANPNGANSAPSKANGPIDIETTVAPPVLPPHGVTKQQNRINNPSVKIVNPESASRSKGGAMTAPIRAGRNAIGQPMPPPKNPIDAQPSVQALQRPAAVSPIIHGGTVTAPVSPGAARVNLANTTIRSSVNGATVIRPTTAPAAIGGPAQPRFGINGTTVQSRR